MTAAKPSMTDTPEEYLRRWLSCSPGRTLLIRETQCLETLLADLFGYYLLQIGWSWAFQAPIAHSRIRHRLFLDPQFPGMGGNHTVISAATALPIATDSVDVVFLPHTLDGVTDPYQILCEVERVLIPEGRIILLGFHAWSYCHLWRCMGTKHLPGLELFNRHRQVMRWLFELGFTVERQPGLMWLLPLGCSRLFGPLQHLEPIAARWASGVSAVYALRAVKRVATPTPLGRIWQRPLRLLAGHAVESTTRETPHV